jgi:hypothetical protein
MSSVRIAERPPHNAKEPDPIYGPQLTVSRTVHAMSSPQSGLPTGHQQGNEHCKIVLPHADGMRL